MPDQQAEAKDDPTGARSTDAAKEELAPLAVVVQPAQPPISPPPRVAQRNPIFAELVQGEDDLAGLVGYGLYKLNKRDWHASFFKAHGRDPTEGEIASYVLGERTPRRLGTYRHLAEDLIGRKTAAAAGQAQGSTVAAASRISAMKEASLRSSLPSAAPAAAPARSRRSPTATLLFWIVVLLVLAMVTAYINYPTFFQSR
ncbi:MAG: hypothetical protein ACHQAY_16745 [Hyphomicrobiales bacterium]